MGPDDEAALDSCTAYDTMPAAASLPPPSVIRPTLPNVVQVPVGPATGTPSNPVLSTVPQPVTPPPVPQLPQRTDTVVGPERVVDPNDKGFSFTGTWDTSGPNRAPRVTGVSADVPSTSPRIHGDPAQLDLPGGGGGGQSAPPSGPPAPQPRTVTIPMPDLTPPQPRATSPAGPSLLPPISDPAAPWQWNQRTPIVPDHFEHTLPMPETPSSS